ncbi:MAG TPA: MBL fold hydrolase [Bacteroidetes bacterium]|nr:MBL fold hydrolase [Bacteroidota bacterium]
MLQIQVFTFNPFSENTYLVYNDKGVACLFDPGCSNALEQGELMAFLKDNKLSLESLFLTHAHIDHILGYAWVYETFSLKARANEKEISVFQRGVESAMLFGVPYEAGPGLQVDLHHGDKLQLLGESWELREAPGHSPGSILFINHAMKWVIAGDVLFRESIGRSDLPGGNQHALFQSIQRELYSLPDDYIVFPGHGPETTIGHEKRFNPFVRP